MTLAVRRLGSVWSPSVAAAAGGPDRGYPRVGVNEHQLGVEIAVLARKARWLSASPALGCCFGDDVIEDGIALTRIRLGWINAELVIAVRPSDR